MIGTTVAHYQILRQLGAGGMGVVYLAEDLRLRRKVALKFLLPTVAQDLGARVRFEREAQAASALDHPNIATVYEIADVGGQTFIAMAHYDGETLAERLRRGPLELPEVASVVAQIADGLAAAHAAGMVHRDLKPANLIITPAGQVKILDFGLAKMASALQETGAGITAAGVTMGTAAYMSPEQIRGEPVDARADVWALGAVLHEMLTGRPPFRGDHAVAIMHAAVADPPIPVLSVRPDAPDELVGLVERALEKNPGDRTLRAEEIAATAAAVRARLSGQLAALAADRGALRRRWGTMAAVVVLAIAAGGWWAYRSARVRWARTVALPEVVRVAEAEQFVAAFDLAVEAERYIPRDVLLARQLATISRELQFQTDPPGAEVSYREYGRPDAPWRRVGRTPLTGVRVPRGMFHWRAELPGRVVAEDVGPGPFGPAVFSLTLDEPQHVPDGMVRIASTGSPFSIYIPGLDHLPRVDLHDFWIDRTEVTNRQFKRFVDAGGYRNRRYWTQPFVERGRTLSWGEATARFRDATGRPGPAMWELGSYAAGHDDYPVTGVSWYEAAAYAELTGKRLPTIFHWSRVADQRLSASIVPVSNFGGTGPRPVGESGAVHRAGAVDMAGNVKEWCWNAGGPDTRYILGGAYGEPVYMFTDADARSPFDREATFGFRCVRLMPGDQTVDAVAGAVEPPSRDYARERPVRDEVFQAYRSLYSYDRTPLDARVESVDTSASDWRREKVSFRAGYGGERLTAYLFLPTNAAPPFQTVVYFPGSNAITQRSSDGVDPSRFDFILKSGRALIFPVYKGTFERGGEIHSDYPDMTSVWRDHVIMWSKDLGRAIDYLETRPEIARDKIAYVGVSWGGAMGAHLPALEPRLKLAVLIVGGFYLQRALPEADTINFAPRVTIPVLMLNGRYDFFYPTERSQEPMFRLLGTPAAHKRRIVYETGHTIPRTELIRESLDWLDKHWGPAR